MLAIWFMIFWIPPIASAVLLVASWRMGELPPRQLLFLASWCLVAALLQFRGGSTALWVSGLVLQVALGVYLSVRWKLGS